MTEPMLLWGLGLLGLAVLLVIVEVLIPSGGLIAVVSAISAIASIVCFFRYDPTVWGPLSLIAVLVMAPTSVVFALKVWPNTYFGRQLILGSNDSAEELEARAAREAEERTEARSIVGAEGVAKTDLRPVGAAEIEGERVEVLGVGEPIASGDRVRVIEVSGSTIKVRKA